MQGEINEAGNLRIERRGQWNTQYCPFFPNYRDAILKALRRLERVPAAAIKEKEADPNGEKKDG